MLRNWLFYLTCGLYRPKRPVHKARISAPRLQRTSLDCFNTWDRLPPPSAAWPRTDSAPPPMPRRAVSYPPDARLAAPARRPKILRSWTPPSLVAEQAIEIQPMRSPTKLPAIRHLHVPATSPRSSDALRRRAVQRAAEVRAVEELHRLWSERVDDPFDLAALLDAMPMPPPGLSPPATETYLPMWPSDEPQG